MHFTGDELAFADEPEVAIGFFGQQISARLGGVLSRVLANEDALLDGEILRGMTFPTGEVFPVEQPDDLFALR